MSRDSEPQFGTQAVIDVALKEIMDCNERYKSLLNERPKMGPRQHNTKRIGARENRYNVYRARRHKSFKVLNSTKTRSEVVCMTYEHTVRF